MKSTRQSHTLQRAYRLNTLVWLCLTAACIVLCSGSALAQSARPDKKALPPSFSNKKVSAPKSGVTALPVSEESLADAVLADALGDLWQQTDVHYHEGEFSHAVNLSRIIVQGDPKNYEAYENSAWLLWSTDRNDQAIEFLKQGIKANPNTFAMYDELGTHYRVRLNDFASALPYYQQAVKFECPFVTWHGLALCYEKLNQWDKAVDAWEKAALYPKDDMARARVVRARAELARHNGGKN